MKIAVDNYLVEGNSNIIITQPTMKKTITNSREDFLAQFRILHNAAVPVVLCRTREPARAEEALKRWTLENDKGIFKRWDLLTGWSEFTRDSRERPQPDRKLEIIAALKAITDFDNRHTANNAAWKDGIFVVQYPHWVIKQPPLIMLLKEYAATLTETDKQVVLICPEETQLPVELQNDVTVLDFDLPRPEELREVFDNMIESALEAQPDLSFTDEEIGMLVNSGQGLTESEYDNALARAIIEARGDGEMTAERLNEVLLGAKTEVVKRSEVLELMDTADMEEIGGLDVAKGWITKRRQCFSEEAADFGIDKPKGIAAIGPPGTGKSVFAKAIAGLLGQPLIRFDIGKVFGSLVGQSEERVRAALKQLDAMAPCVAFIDEVDKAGIDPRQGGGDSGTSQRVMGNILTHMQESLAPVFWVLTANRVDSLPPELLRKGRLDEVFAILPPNDAEREDIARIHLAKRKHNPDELDDMNIVVKMSSGFVGAEIEAAIKEALIDAYADDVELTGQMIADQLQGMKPISEAFADDFNRMREWAEQNARLASSPGDGSVVTVPAKASPRRRRLKKSQGE